MLLKYSIVLLGLRVGFKVGLIRVRIKARVRVVVEVGIRMKVSSHIMTDLFKRLDYAAMHGSSG